MGHPPPRRAAAGKEAEQGGGWPFGEGERGPQRLRFFLGMFLRLMREAICRSWHTWQKVRTSALALLLGDVLAAHARGDLPLVAHLPEGADLRGALLGHVELEILPGVALRAPLQKHLAREGLQAQEVPLARGLVVLGARGHHVEAQYGAPVRGLPRGQRGARALPADVVRAEAGVVVVPQDPPVDPLVALLHVRGHEELRPQRGEAELLVVAQALHALELA